MFKTKENEKSLFKITWPIFIETLLFMMLGFVDIWMLSKVSDSAAAAVGGANQIIYIFGILFAIVSGATAVLVSQNLGAQRREEASKVTALALAMNLLLGLVCTGVVLIFKGGLLKSVGLNGELLQFGKEYLGIVGGFLFVQAVLNTLTAVIRSHGNTQASMKVTFLMNTINICLDAVFILGLFGFPVLGVKGVAIATSISRVIGIILLGRYLFKNYEEFAIFNYLRPFPLENMKKILKVGIPSAFEMMNYNIVQIVIMKLILEYFGNIEYITKTYVSNIVMFFYIFSVAIGQGNQILVGHCVGEGNIEEADRVCMKSLRSALCFSIIMSSIGVIFRFKLIGIYTDDARIIKLAGILLIVDLFVEFGRCFNIVLINGLRGAGDTVFPVVMAIISMWGITTVFAVILGVHLGWGLVGMWIAFAMDEIFRGFCMLGRWKRGKWKTKSLVH